MNNRPEDKAGIEQGVTWEKRRDALYESLTSTPGVEMYIFGTAQGLTIPIAVRFIEKELVEYITVSQTDTQFERRKSGVTISNSTLNFFSSSDGRSVVIELLFANRDSGKRDGFKCFQIRIPYMAKELVELMRSEVIGQEIASGSTIDNTSVVYDVIVELWGHLFAKLNEKQQRELGDFLAAPNN